MSDNAVVLTALLLAVCQFHSSMLLAAEPAGTNAAVPPRGISFDRDIRPILADNCFVCHGPDETDRQAGLRLDLRANAIVAVESGAVAIVPGKPDASELIKRVTSTDDNVRMPPLKGKHKPLTATQIDMLKRWIAGGAEYTSHWAFKAPVVPAIPNVDETRYRIRNQIDRFVAAKLAENGLTQSPETDKITLPVAACIWT